MFGAILSRYSILKHNPSIDINDVEIINVDDNTYFNASINRKIIRGGKEYIWDRNDLQSFTLLRFLPPKIMNYKGFSMVIDPDIFAVSNFTEKLKKLKTEKIIMSKKNKDGKNGLATSLMIFNNELCRSLQLDDKINKVLKGELDYNNLMNLNFLNENQFFELNEDWNSFDKLNKDTIFLHTTNRITQPWKTGLEVDFVQNYPKFRYKIIPNSFIRNLKEFIMKKKFPPYKYYIDHPDKDIKDFFFNLLGQAYSDKFIDHELILKNIENKFIRNDIFKKIPKKYLN